MAPKGKAKAKAAPKENDASNMEDVLQKWHEAKAMEDDAKKIIESCKTAVEMQMAKTGQTCIATVSFTVDKRTQSRESVSVKDLPADIRAQYAKTSEFSVLTLKPVGGKPKAKAKGVKK